MDLRVVRVVALGGRVSFRCTLPDVRLDDPDHWPGSVRLLPASAPEKPSTPRWISRFAPRDGQRIPRHDQVGARQEAGARRAGPAGSGGCRRSLWHPAVVQENACPGVVRSPDGLDVRPVEDRDGGENETGCRRGATAAVTVLLTSISCCSCPPPRPTSAPRREPRDAGRSVFTGNRRLGRGRPVADQAESLRERERHRHARDGLANPCAHDRRRVAIAWPKRAGGRREGARCGDRAAAAAAR